MEFIFKFLSDDYWGFYIAFNPISNEWMCEMRKTEMSSKKEIKIEKKIFLCDVPLTCGILAAIKRAHILPIDRILTLVRVWFISWDEFLCELRTEKVIIIELTTWWKCVRPILSVHISVFILFAWIRCFITIDSALWVVCRCKIMRLFMRREQTISEKHPFGRIFYLESFQLFHEWNTFQVERFSEQRSWLQSDFYRMIIPTTKKENRITECDANCDRTQMQYNKIFHFVLYFSSQYFNNFEFPVARRLTHVQ